ncbi:hypothetical protein ACUY28_01560 [Corynebacterium sanguinis]|uniref:hypothetical protein n=1 Tax=Corynebacterium sanguinis TaxID=2594913 RepID=UPI00223AD277|nr:hypothetical protein [Corynebacterium sanguinis]MCT1627950.1 hypothetical protein [Corynebacterium sanguinis]
MSDGRGVDIQPDPARTDIATKDALASIESNEVNVNATNLTTSDASAYTITTGEETLNAVTIPVAGEYSYTSNVTIITNTAGDIVQYSETLVDEADNGNFRVRVYNNDKLTKNEVTTLAFMSDDELRTASVVDPNEPMAAARSVGSTVACLAAVAGIGGPVAYLIASACAGACVGVATGVGAAVCAACIGGYATLGAGGMTAAASCFK